MSTVGGSNRMLSAKEVGAILGLPERTIRAEWRRWNLRGYRIGRALRFKESELAAWVEGQAE